MQLFRLRRTVATRLSGAQPEMPFSDPISLTAMAALTSAKGFPRCEVVAVIVTAVSAQERAYLTCFTAIAMIRPA